MDYLPVLVILAIAVVAVAYSTVGHGGASGYLAVMALLGVAPEVTRPTALVLNLFVASIGTYQFWRSGYFSWRVFWPFAVASIPGAFAGGMISLPTSTYKIVLGIVLALAAIRLAWKFNAAGQVKPPPVWAAILIGATIGVVSGLVGIGGGVLLTPILLLSNWSETKTAAGVSALFILVNSVAGLIGNYSQVSVLPITALSWVAAAVIGGIIGSRIGARKLSSLALRRVLAVVLFFAAFKLIVV